jgi:DnaJ family protein A protein 5
MSKKQKKKHKLKAKEALQEEHNENAVSEINEPIEEEETVKIKEAEIVNEKKSSEESKPSICSVCKLEFESRNKLFEHIKAEGHAIVKTVVEKKGNNKKTKAKK